MKKLVAGTGVGLIALCLIAFGAVAARTPEAESLPASAPSHADPLAPAIVHPGLDSTIASLQSQLRDGPVDASTFATLGLAYLQKGRSTADSSWFPKAHKALKRSLSLDDATNTDAFVGLGLLANARHDFVAGRRWAERSISAAPFAADGYGVMGDALTELGRYEEAERALQEMIDLRPDLASYARVSYARELRGEVRGAIWAMERAGAAAGETGPDAAWVESHLGDLYLASGRVAEGEIHYRRARAMDPEGYLPLVGLARVASARGNSARSIALMERVTAVYPSPAYVAFLGDLQAAAGDDAGAGRSYDLVRAEDRLFRAGGVRPDVEITLFLADHGLQIDGNLARARSQYRVRPSVRVADALAWSLFAAGRANEAIRYSDEALRLGTKDALFHFHAGMIRKATGDTAGAAEHLARALELNPDFSVLHAPTAGAALAELTR